MSTSESDSEEGPNIAAFVIARRKTKSLKDAFVVARGLVRNRELCEHFEPSNPLLAGGANVQPFLIAHP
jgi:hypothetical protein